MKTFWDAILKDMLPNKWSRMIAATIPAVLIGTAGLPVALQKSEMSLSPQLAIFLQFPLLLLVLAIELNALLVVLLVAIIYHYRDSRLTSEKFKGYKEIKINKGAIVFVKIGEENSKIYYCSLCFHSQILTPLQPSIQTGFLECRSGHGCFPI